MPLEGFKDWQLGFQGEYSHSQSDGTVEYGDHDFSRASGRVQLSGPQSQTDIFYGSQQKFFGWPNMYTSFGVNETEDLDTELFLVNHQQNYAADSSLKYRLIIAKITIIIFILVKTQVPLKLFMRPKLNR